MRQQAAECLFIASMVALFLSLPPDAGCISLAVEYPGLDNGTESNTQFGRLHKDNYRMKVPEGFESVNSNYAIISSDASEKNIGRDLRAQGGILGILFEKGAYVTPWIGLDIGRSDRVISYAQSDTSIRFQMGDLPFHVFISNNTMMIASKMNTSLSTNWDPYTSLMYSSLNGDGRVGPTYNVTFSNDFQSYSLAFVISPEPFETKYAFVPASKFVPGSSKNEEVVLVLRWDDLSSRWILDQDIKEPQNPNAPPVASNFGSIPAPFGSSIVVNQTILVIGAPTTQPGGVIYWYRYEQISKSRPSEKRDLQNDVGRWRYVATTTNPSSKSSLFGVSMAMNGQFLVVGASGSISKGSSISIFKKSSSLPWSLIYTYDAPAGSFIGRSVDLETFYETTYVVTGSLEMKAALVWRIDDLPSKTTVEPRYALQSTYATKDIGYSVATTREMFFYSGPNFGSDSKSKSYIFVKVLCYPNRWISATDGCSDCDLGTYSDGGLATQCKKCDNLPPNSSWIKSSRGCVSACNPGFFGPRCLPCDQYAPSIGFPSLPANSSWVAVNNTCTIGCYPGFSLEANGAGTKVCSKCFISKPEHSVWDLNTCTWKCDERFFGPRCQPCSVFMQGQNLPENAYWDDENNSTCTWKCKAYHVPNESNTACVTCEEGVLVPVNAHFSTPTCGYSCNIGFYGDECVDCRNYKLSIGDSPPVNAAWTYHNNTSCCWECLDGYLPYSSTPTMRMDSCYDSFAGPVVCCPSSLQPLDVVVYDFKCNPTCRVGYFSLNQKCVTCSQMQIANNVTLPSNAVWIDGLSTCNWGCKQGYVRNGQFCCPTIPTNSVFSNKFSCDYTCKYGYFGNTCDVCSDYAIDQNEILPPNAYWVDYAYDCFWTCESGYYQTSDGLGCCNQKAPYQGFIYYSKGKCVVSCQAGYAYNSARRTCDWVDCSGHGHCQSCLGTEQCGWCDSSGRCINLADPSQSCSATYIDECPLPTLLIFGVAAGGFSGFFCIGIACYIMKKRSQLRRQAQVLSLQQAPQSRVALINDLEQKVLQQDDSSDPCTICLEEFKIGNTIRKLPCSHIFHSACIEKWLLVSRFLVCPICRDSLTGAEAMPSTISVHHEAARSEPIGLYVEQALFPGEVAESSRSTLDSHLEGIPPDSRTSPRPTVRPIGEAESAPPTSLPASLVEQDTDVQNADETNTEIRPDSPEPTQPVQSPSISLPPIPATTNDSQEW